MRGMNAITGKALSGRDHLLQSIGDILRTPIGSRVMRRNYGSRIPALLDAPANADTVIEVYAAVAEALDAWEPRFKLESVTLISASSEGALELLVKGTELDDSGRPIGEKLEGVVVI
ncbi:MAG: GPW/gp25 family protein [Halodesulfovibrio sp.]|jgi:hypothetical protein